MRLLGVRLGTVGVCLGLATAALGGFPSTDVFFPAVGRVPGAGGAQFYSTIWVTNLSSSDAVHFTFHFLKGGQANDGAVPSFDDTLAPGETKIYENVVEEKLGLGNALGAGRIVADGEVFASERIYNQARADDNLGTTEGLFFAGVPASFAIGLGESATVQGINQGDPSEDMRTNFALVETAGESATVHVALLDHGGATLGAADFPLKAYEQLQPNVAQLFSGISTINARLVAAVTGGAGKVIMAAAQLANTSQDSSGFEMSFKGSLLDGGGTAGVASLNGLTGVLSLVAGKNVTISKVGSTELKIDATGGGGTGLTLPFSGTVSSSDPAFEVDNSGSGMAIYGHTGGANGEAAVVGASQNGPGVYGQSNASAGNSAGVVGLETYPSGLPGFLAGVWGDSHDHYGVIGTSSEAPGIYARSRNNSAVIAHSEKSYAILADNSSGAFPTIEAINDSGAAGAFAIQAGIAGTAGNSATAVKGEADSDNGSGLGVWGQAQSGYGVYGVSATGLAGKFAGSVDINGTIHTSAVGAVTLDDPRDPENSTISHAFVTSSEMKNVYDGVATLDPSGVAEVVLPDWFESLNRDFRYQLTAVGTPQPGLFVAKKVAGSRFRIAGGVPGAEVSWQITGVRKDPWAEGHPMAVAKPKPETGRGLYIDPELYGQPKTKSADPVQRRAARVAAGEEE